MERFAITSPRASSPKQSGSPTGLLGGSEALSYQRLSSNLTGGRSGSSAPKRVHRLCRALAGRSSRYRSSAPSPSSQPFLKHNLLTEGGHGPPLSLPHPNNATRIAGGERSHPISTMSSIVLSFPFLLLSLWLSLSLSLFPFFSLSVPFPSSSSPLAFRIYLLFPLSFSLFFPSLPPFFSPSLVSHFLTSCIYPMYFFKSALSPALPLFLGLRYLSPSVVSLHYSVWGACIFLTSSLLVFLISISLSFLSSFRFSFTFSLYAHPLFSLLRVTLCFLLLFPFICHFFHSAICPRVTLRNRKSIICNDYS